jgi:hypothetical protein
MCLLYVNVSDFMGADSLSQRMNEFTASDI